MATLISLPIELLLQIHLFSLSPSLPHLTRSLYSTFSHSPSSHKSAYILSHCEQSEKGLRRAVQKAIKFPIGCNMDVVGAVERDVRKWLEALSRRRRDGKMKRKGKAVRSDDEDDDDQLSSDLARSQTSRKKLKCPHLTRALLSLSPIPYTLIAYLLSTYHTSPNSSNGYFLSKAIMLGDLKLMELLLDWGADAGQKDGWAVRFAIERDWTTEGEGEGLRVVKRLMLRSPDALSRPSPLALSRSITPPTSPPSSPPNHTRHITTSFPPHSHQSRPSQPTPGLEVEESNRERLRFPPTQSFLESAVKYKKWTIVDWLVEMGATPSLGCLGML